MTSAPGGGRRFPGGKSCGEQLLGPRARVLEPFAQGSAVADEAHETLSAAGARMARSGRALLFAAHALRESAELVRAGSRAADVLPDAQALLRDLAAGDRGHERERGRGRDRRDHDRGRAGLMQSTGPSWLKARLLRSCATWCPGRPALSTTLRPGVPRPGCAAAKNLRHGRRLRGEICLYAPVAGEARARPSLGNLALAICGRRQQQSRRELLTSDADSFFQAKSTRRTCATSGGKKPECACCPCPNPRKRTSRHADQEEERKYSETWGRREPESLSIPANLGFRGRATICIFSVLCKHLTDWRYRSSRIGDMISHTAFCRFFGFGGRGIRRTCNMLLDLRTPDLPNLG